MLNLLTAIAVLHIQAPTHYNRRHTLEADDSPLPFSSGPLRLAGALKEGPGRVPLSSAPQVAWGNGDTQDSAAAGTTWPVLPDTTNTTTNDQRTALQKEFQAVQRARAVEQAGTRARLAQLQM